MLYRLWALVSKFLLVILFDSSKFFGTLSSTLCGTSCGMLFVQTNLFELNQGLELIRIFYLGAGGGGRDPRPGGLENSNLKDFPGIKFRANHCMSC